MKIKLFLSDLIGDDYKSWRGGKNIFLAAGTGAGKTYFITGRFLAYVISERKRMLILTPRKTLQQKYLADIFDYAIRYDVQDIENYVQVKNYQHLEAEIISGGCVPEFDFYILDECHYFLTDAMFNPNTEISFEYLVNHRRCSAKIFISATGQRVFEKVKKKLGIKEAACVNIDADNYRYNENRKRLPSGTVSFETVSQYYLPSDYSYLVVRYLPTEFNIADVVRYDVENQWVVFVSSIDQGEKFLKQLTESGIDAVFLNSANLSDYEEVVTSVTINERFNQHVLITTAVIEAGVNFKDEKLKNIILLADTREVFIQMLGRRRIFGDADSVNLYIPIRSETYFVSRAERMANELNMCREVVSEMSSFADIVDIMLMDSEKQTCVKKILTSDRRRAKTNRLYLEELIARLDFYKQMSCRMKADQYFFIRTQLNWLGLSPDFSDRCFVSNQIRQDALNEFTQLVRGQIRQKSELPIKEGKQFLNSLIPYAAKVDLRYAGTAIFSFKVFNDFCLRNKLPFQCLSKSIKIGTVYTFDEEKNSDEEVK